MTESRPDKKGLVQVLPYAVTIFLSAFLLFEVQPLIAKYILPWFGGAPAVWTACLLFFQVLLLAGYAYAHLINSLMGPKGQKAVHLSLLLASLLVLAYLGSIWQTPITPAASWRSPVMEDPIERILILLAVSVGLPYFILSSTAPLLQSWYGRTFPGVSPYRLYALSNLGSLLALLGYPFAIEWLLRIPTQARAWSWTYFAFALCCGFSAVKTTDNPGKNIGSAAPDGPPAPGPLMAEPAQRPTPGRYVLWLALAACGSTMLLATTNQLCLGVAAVPFLWVFPLSLYLLSFIICFQNERWYKREVFQPAFTLGAVMIAYTLYRKTDFTLLPQIGIYSFALFACCMACHGELVRLKPAPQHLTGFYLSVAAGGALGGLFVCVLAPHLFSGYWEYHLGLWGSALLILIVLWVDETSWLYQSPIWLPILIVVGACLLPVALAVSVNGGRIPRDWRLPVMAILATGLIVKLTHRNQRESAAVVSSDLTKFSAVAALVMLGGILFIDTRKPKLEAARNFYGVLSIAESYSSDPSWRAYGLSHGPILHGLQFQERSKRHIPGAYYGGGSAVSVMILNHPKRKAARPEDRHLRIGVAGLGVGTIAAFGQPGDYVRFYEINPDVYRFATSRYFTYLKDSAARVEVILGDARLSMERELEHNEPQQFDILVLDAFAGDAIPVHLLTREAFEIYLQHLGKPNGLIAIHISNTFLDLRPVLWKTAEYLELHPAWFHAPKEGRISGPSDWVVLAPNRALLDLPAVARQIRPAQFFGSSARLWTDDYSNLVQCLKR